MKKKNWKPGQRVTLNPAKFVHPIDREFIAMANEAAAPLPPIQRKQWKPGQRLHPIDKEMLKLGDAKLIRRKSTAPLPMPGRVRKKPTAPKKLIDKLKRKKIITGPEPEVKLHNVECDNQNCTHNSMHGGKIDYSGKALCKLERISLTKTWAGSEKNYRLLCVNASDYPIKVKTESMLHDRDVGVDEHAARKFKGTT